MDMPGSNSRIWRVHRGQANLIEVIPSLFYQAAAHSVPNTPPLSQAIWVHIYSRNAWGKNNNKQRTPQGDCSAGIMALVIGAFIAFGHVFMVCVCVTMMVF